MRVWIAFISLILCLLALDLGIFHRTARVVTVREALGWSVAWFVLAIAFGGFVYGAYEYKWLGLGASDDGRSALLKYLTGYIVEESLSVDNMFVFVVVFGFFGSPQQFQHRVLFYGILGALIFRAIFIALGSALLHFQWMIFVFGAILILTGIKMMFGGGGAIDPNNNRILRIVKRFIPITDSLHGPRFFVSINGKLFGTPLLLCLIFLELTDILFAVDSVPAIFGVTSEPLIVFTSNIFAILGLRSLFFLLAGAVHLFHLLKYGLSTVLIFVGLKMVWLNKLFDGHFPIALSLAIILGVIGASIGLSLLFPKKPDEELAA